MRITRSMFAIFSRIDGAGWVSGGEIARRVGQPRQNLNYALRSMVDAGVLERSNTSPIHYRVVPEPDATTRTIIADIKNSQTIFESQE